MYLGLFKSPLLSCSVPEPSGMKTEADALCIVISTAQMHAALPKRAHRPRARPVSYDSCRSSGPQRLFWLFRVIPLPVDVIDHGGRTSLH